jgi:hypothetical protein
VVEYDLLWGPTKTIGDDLWPDGPPDDLEDLKSYETWAGLPRMWYAPLDWIDYTKSGFFTNEYSLGMQYMSMLYYGVLILGSNELGPVNEIEMLYMIGVLLISAFANALIFGDIATLAQVLGKKSNELQSKLDAGNTVMAAIHLDYKTSQEIREFFNRTQSSRDGQEELDHFFDQISPSLKIKVQDEIFQKSIMKSSILQDIL